MATVHQFGEPDETERIVIGFLRSALPAEFDLYCNIDLKDRVGFPKECDVVVLGPFGAEIIETKGWRGRITGNQQWWRFEDGRSFANPFALLNKKARILRSQLDRNAIDAPVTASLTYVDPGTRFAIAGEPQHVDIVHYKTLTRRFSGQRVSELHLQRARQQLVSSAPAAPKASRFESFEVLYEVRRDDDERVLIVNNPLIPRLAPKRLKLVSLDVYRKADERRQLLDQVQRELAVLQGVPPHPNVMRPLMGEIFRNELFGTLFDHVEGQPLSSILAESTKLSDTARLQLVIGVARGLAHAHRHKIIHRLLTPHAVWVTRDGTPVVTDFDSARDLNLDLPTLGPLIAARLSPRYAAPEAGTPRAATERTDTYSVGVILHDMFRAPTGFPGDSAPPDLSEPLDCAPSIESDLRDMIARATARQPSQRPGNLDEFADELSILL